MHTVFFYIIPRKFCFTATHLSADGKQKPYLCTHMFQFSPVVPSRRSVRVPRVPSPSVVASSHPPSLTPHSGYSQRAACWSWCDEGMPLPSLTPPPPPPHPMSLPAETSPLGSRGQCTATLGPVAKPGRQLVLGPVPMLQLIISFSWALISNFLAFGTGVNLKRFMCAKGDGYKPVKARDSNCA